MLKFKGTDKRAPPGIEPEAYFDSTWEISSNPEMDRIHRLTALSQFRGLWYMAIFHEAIYLVNSN